MEIGSVGTSVNLSINTTLHLDNARHASITDFSVGTFYSDGASAGVDCLCSILTTEALSKQLLNC